MDDELLYRYRWATQDPAAQAALLAAVYQRVRGREPLLLREDFAGNAADSVAFVAASSARRAIAVDRHAPTLTHARTRAGCLLGGDVARIDFHRANVLRLAPPAVDPVDVLAALNFSIGYWHDRSALLSYFKHARRCIAAEGIVIVNTFGGPACMRHRIDRYPVTPGVEPGQPPLAPFDYLFEYRSFDAATARIDCRIHFEWPDTAARGGRRQRRNAFRYDWRLWTLPELCEGLLESGFARAEVWRHTAEQRDGRTHVELGPVNALREKELWLAYVVAWQ